MAKAYRARVRRHHARQQRQSSMVVDQHDAQRRQLDEAALVCVQLMAADFEKEHIPGAFIVARTLDGRYHARAIGDCAHRPELMLVAAGVLHDTGCAILRSDAV